MHTYIDCWTTAHNHWVLKGRWSYFSTFLCFCGYHLVDKSSFVQIIAFMTSLFNLWQCERWIAISRIWDHLIMVEINYILLYILFLYYFPNSTILCNVSMLESKFSFLSEIQNHQGEVKSWFNVLVSTFLYKAANGVSAWRSTTISHFPPCHSLNVQQLIPVTYLKTYFKYYLKFSSSC